MTPIYRSSQEMTLPPIIWQYIEETTIRCKWKQWKNQFTSNGNRDRDRRQYGGTIKKEKTMKLLELDFVAYKEIVPSISLWWSFRSEYTHARARFESVILPPNTIYKRFVVILLENWKWGNIARRIYNDISSNNVFGFPL